MNEIKNEMKPIKYGHVLNKIKNSFYSHSKPQIQQQFNNKLIQRRFKKGLIKKNRLKEEKQMVPFINCISRPKPPYEK